MPNNGVEVSNLTFGTWLVDDDAADAVRPAAEIDYRRIGTAQAYGNERDVLRSPHRQAASGNEGGRRRPCRHGHARNPPLHGAALLAGE